MDNTEIDRAIDASGGLKVVADALGETKQTLWNWKTRGRVPAERCSDFEKATGLPKWSQRPEDWHRIWPELTDAPGAPAINSGAEA